MRLNIILITIVLGGLISGAVFFIFGYAVNVPNANLEVELPSENRQAEQAFLLPLSENNSLPIRDFNVPEPAIDAKAAALFDVGSGRFLFAQNINRRLPIASITKLMSAIVVLENFNLEQIIAVPAEALNVDGNGADFYGGERLKVLDLLKIMLVKSSNDAALTFAVTAQNMGIDFVAKMNEKARSFGMANTKFTDPAGLDDQEAFSTAADLVKLVRRAANYDLISKTLQNATLDVKSSDGSVKRHLINTDRLLGKIPGIIIGKTGYTDRALGTLALEIAGKGNGGIISIVLGSRDRFAETGKLIEWGKAAYSWE